MITRRTFFHRTFRGATLGSGGIYLAPFLNDLAATESGTKPARVVFFVQANGVYPNEIQPKAIKRDKDSSRLEQQSLDGVDMELSLEPLAPWQDRMTILQGLSGRIARGSHGMGFAALGCWPKNKTTYGETIDAGCCRRSTGMSVSELRRNRTRSLTT